MSSNLHPGCEDLDFVRRIHERDGTLYVVPKYMWSGIPASAQVRRLSSPVRCIANVSNEIAMLEDLPDGQATA